MKNLILKYVSRETLDSIFGELQKMDVQSFFRDKRFTVGKKLSGEMQKMEARMSDYQRFKKTNPSSLRADLESYFCYPVVIEIGSVNEMMGKRLANKLDTIDSILDEIKEKIKGDDLIDLERKKHQRRLKSMRSIAKQMKSQIKNDSLIFREVIPIAGLEDQFPSAWTLKKPDTKPESELKNSKAKAKHYALYHWILIELGMANPFEVDDDDRYSRSEIESFAEEKYPMVSSQSFYRSFIDMDITNKTAISKRFGIGFKEIIEEISNNNAKVIQHLKSFQNR